MKLKSRRQKVKWRGLKHKWKLSTKWRKINKFYNIRIDDDMWKCFKLSKDYLKPTWSQKRTIPKGLDMAGHPGAWESATLQQEYRWRTEYCTEYCIRIRTREGIYGQIYPLAWRSSRGQNPRELLKAKGYIWPYIPSWVLIRTLYHFNSHRANNSLISIIDNQSVYSLGSVLWNIPLTWR